MYRGEGSVHKGVTPGRGLKAVGSEKVNAVTQVTEDVINAGTTQGTDFKSLNALSGGEKDEETRENKPT